MTNFFHRRSAAPLRGLFDNLLDRGASLLAAGIKHVLPTNKHLPLTQLVDALLEQKPHPEADEYLYLDPKAKKGERRD